MPAHPRVAKEIEALLGRFPDLVPSPEVLAWLSDSDRWRAICTVVARDGRGHFLVRTLQGESPAELEDATEAGEGRMLLPFAEESAELVQQLEGLRLDDLARLCARELRDGRQPPPAELSVQMGEDGEPHLTLFHVWDRTPATDFRELSEAHPVHRPGRFFLRDAPWGVSVPADPALAPQLSEFVEAHPRVHVEEPAQELIEELVAEHQRASETVALSYADDAELQDLPLGGELHPFQRAGVRYALERRRTFIADEQGLGKTVQALATIEADEAFPTVVVCPASMKLMWERETQKWLPHRSVAVLEGRTDATWTEETREADIVVLNYDILDWHSETLASLEPRALILDESHYVKNARAARTKAALELADRLPEDALRLGLTGTPILNRAEELVSQLRVLGRLRDFGSGARLTRRFRGRRQRRPPALEPARALLRAAHEEAGPSAAPRQEPGHRAGAALERARVPARGAGRDRLASDAAARPSLDRREGGRRAARRAARAAQPPASARRARQAAHRARVDRGLPRVRRAARGVRRAHRHAEGRDGALPEGGPHPRERTRPRSGRTPWTRSRARTARS